MSKDKIYLDNCTFVKTILMLLVVFYHSTVFWTGNWFTVQKVAIDDQIIANLSLWLNTFHIYTFVAISGYLFEFLKNEKCKYKDFKKFLLNKLKRLIVPYCFVAIIWVIPISLLFYSYTGEEIIHKFLLCESPGQLWFLWMLFDIFILIWLLNIFLKNTNFVLIISLLSCVIGFIGKKCFLNIFCIWDAFTYLPYFIIGMKLRKNRNGILYKIPSLAYFFIHIILFTISLYIADFKGIIINVICNILNFTIHIIGVLMAFFILQNIAQKTDWKNRVLLVYFSKISMPIYLFHQQIIYFTITFFNGRINPLLNIIVNFFAAIFISSLLSSIMLKYKYTRLLIGEK